MNTDRVDAAGLTDAGFAAIQDRIDAGVDGYGNLQTRADARALAAEVVRLRTARDEAEAKVAEQTTDLERIEMWAMQGVPLGSYAPNVAEGYELALEDARAALAGTSPPHEGSEP